MFAFVWHLSWFEIGEEFGDFLFDSGEAIVGIGIFEEHGLGVFVSLLEFFSLAVGLLYLPGFLFPASTFFLFSGADFFLSLLFLGFESGLFLAVEVEPVGLAFYHDHLSEGRSTY